jgi:hypothetical protein
MSHGRSRASHVSLGSWSLGLAVAAAFACGQVHEVTSDGGRDVDAAAAGGDPDGSGTGSGDAGANLDAGEELCGYPGEACCTGPFAACIDGASCSGDVCVVSELWVVGSFINSNTFKPDGVSLHYDGDAWTAGPAIGEDSLPWGLWGSSTGSYRAVMDDGTIRLLSTDRWLVCGSFGCSDPPTNNRLYDIFGFSGSDFWVAAQEGMYQCDGTECTPRADGLPASWGQGNLTGTSSSDLWYASLDRALHFDGSAWTIHSDIQARAIWARADDDVWAGDRFLQHFDGETWSQNYTIGGGQAPGIITSISGTASDDVWAVGYEGSTSPHVAFSAHFDGTSWSLVPMPETARDLEAVWAASRNEVFAVGDRATIFTWDGEAWSQMDTPSGLPEGLRWRAIAGRARPRP